VIVRRRNALAVVVLSSVGCRLPLDNGPLNDTVVVQDSDGGPAAWCVVGFHVGQTYSATLGQVYDATSDYEYDAYPSFLQGARDASCGGVDGLMTGSIVQFVPQKQLGLSETGNGFDGCAPLAEFEPASLENTPRLVTGTLNSVNGVTIAAAFSEGVLAGQKAFVVVGLFTPSRNALGTLTPRQLPPLVVSRTLQTEDWTRSCSDAWVATWTP